MADKKISRNEIAGWMLCAPALIIFAIFFIGPALVGLGVSMNEWDGFSSTMEFVGFKNYSDLFGDRAFWNSMRINAMVILGMVFLKIPIAFLIANGLSKGGRGKGFFRTAIFVPHMLSATVVGTMWVFLLDPYNGFVNKILIALGLEQFTHGWLVEMDSALISAIVASIWWTMGIHVVLFMAGMAGIPGEYYDAIHLETSNPFLIFRYVTIPMLREQFFISFVMSVGGAFGYLTGLFNIMTKGGPANKTELLGLLSTKLAFRSMDSGSANAVSVIMVILVMSLTIIPTLKIARSRLEY
jgi:ABC-type sugar transport system permease subunit